MYKTWPSEWVLVILSFSKVPDGFTKFGLYFHPPITIINSKKIIELIISPIGMCLELDFDKNH